MKIVVVASDNQWMELTSNNTDIQWIRVAEHFSFADYEEADFFFLLQEETPIVKIETQKPVIINSVTETLKGLKTPVNVIRINGWNTFLQRPLWEVAGTLSQNLTALFNKLNKTVKVVNDEPGFVSARIIAMIINEAYFAFGEKVSTKAEIDIAMKLGTNYPFGPFEWAEKIGLIKIYTLLQQLSLNDNRYQPAPMLISEALKTNQ